MLKSAIFSPGSRIMIPEPSVHSASNPTRVNSSPTIARGSVTTPSYPGRRNLALMSMLATRSVNQCPGRTHQPCQAASTATNAPLAAIPTTTSLHCIRQATAASEKCTVAVSLILSWDTFSLEVYVSVTLGSIPDASSLPSAHIARSKTGLRHMGKQGNADIARDSSSSSGRSRTTVNLVSAPVSASTVSSTRPLRPPLTSKYKD